MSNEENTKEKVLSSPHRITGREAIQQNVAEAFERARRRLAIYAPTLDPYYFNASGIGLALARFAAGGRPNLARFIVYDSGRTFHDNSRIINLAQRLSDFVQLRKLGEEFGVMMEMFIVIDQNGYLRQPDTTKPECLVDFDATVEAAKLKERFERMWEKSEPMPGIHVTGLSRS